MPLPQAAPGFSAGIGLDFFNQERFVRNRDVPPQRDVRRARAPREVLGRGLE
jgi:hypothetical protein